VHCDYKHLLPPCLFDHTIYPRNLIVGIYACFTQAFHTSTNPYDQGFEPLKLCRLECFFKGVRQLDLVAQKLDHEGIGALPA
jgi:hypothetical protein